MDWVFTIIAYFPIVSAVLGILSLFAYLILRMRKNAPAKKYMICGCIGIGVCILFYSTLFLVGFLGIGPVPS